MNRSAHKSEPNKTSAGFGLRPRYNERIYVLSASARDNARRLKKVFRDFVEGSPNLVGILAGVVVIGISAAILFNTINWSYYYACSTASEAVVAARPYHWAADFKSCSIYCNLLGENGDMAGVTVSGDFVGPNPRPWGSRNQRYRVFMTRNHGILKVRSVYIDEKP